MLTDFFPFSWYLWVNSEISLSNRALLLLSESFPAHVVLFSATVRGSQISFSVGAALLNSFRIHQV
jgi:hypothetical protein